MAKYSLILKDATFVKLLQTAADKGLTFGKYVNECLNKLADEPIKDPVTLCFVCGAKSSVEVHGFAGASIFLCSNHKEYTKLGKGWRELEAV